MADSQRIRAGSEKPNEVKLTMNLPFDIVCIAQFSFDESSAASPWALTKHVVLEPFKVC